MIIKPAYVAMKQLMKPHLPSLLLALAVLLPAQAHSATVAHPEDAIFLQARDGVARGDRARVAKAAAQLKTHPLAPWAQYFQLLQRLDDGSDTGVADFIERHEGSYLAEKLRGDWLRLLMRKEDWSEARSLYARLQRPDADTQCRGLDIRLRIGEPEALNEARNLLAGQAPLPEPCFAPLGRLAAAGELGSNSLWERLRRQLALGKLKEARIIAGWLPNSEEPAWKAIETAGEHPARYLTKLPDRFATTRAGRETVMYAIYRIARSEAHVAAARWRDLENQFPADERGFVWGRIALASAMALQPEAVAWFDQAEALGTQFDDEQHAWRVRAALRVGQWSAVARAITAMPAPLAALPDWVYWRARAHAAQGDTATARALYERIAGQAHFYSILATEALGRSYALPARAAPPTAEEMAAVSANAGFERSLALIRLDMRVEGVREWIWSAYGMSDRQWLAAAELARRNDAIDRAINTADRTVTEHDFAQRYPTPFLAQVEPRARQVGLDPAWVYGLMRQESRFIMDAKSSAGAKGLMQLMPATAKWVAQKIGMTNFSQNRVTDMDVNVTLGTHYMKMVMDGLDNHPVLTSAGYNAGPGRALKWRADKPLEGAIYAESIPFTETRDYVKKVLANAMSYAPLMNLPTPTLTQRLGTIRPRVYGDTTVEKLP